MDLTALVRFPYGVLIALVATVSMVLLLNDVAPLVAVILLVPFIFQEVLIAFDLNGAAEVSASQVTRLRSKGDGAVITSRGAQTWARIVLIVVGAVIALHLL